MLSLSCLLPAVWACMSLSRWPSASFSCWSWLICLACCATCCFMEFKLLFKSSMILLSSSFNLSWSPFAFPVKGHNRKEIQRKHWHLCLAYRYKRGEYRYKRGEYRYKRGSTNIRGGSTDIRRGSTDLRGGSTDIRGGSTDIRGGSTDIRRGSTDIRGGSTDIRGGSTDIRQGSTRSMQKSQNRAGNHTKTWPKPKLKTCNIQSSIFQVIHSLQMYFFI